ncbi:MAG TPA: formylmethanofuran dehydrogenase [Syntrophomonadaceae bacterium]|nr:formylmethanofuran dehydrogenase [Syntrophomonadaceae bacterium]
MRTLEEDLAAAIKYHGHLCSGMILGVRMARFALKQLSIDDPLNYRDLVVYVEMDRCVADAVSVVTGCTLGKRRLKWIDLGKVAATFVDLNQDRALRVAVLPGCPHPEPGEEIVEFWGLLSDEDIYRWQEVKVDIPLHDLPGKPRNITNCESCGEQVLDGREVIKGDRTLCRACAQGTYYLSAPVL